MAERPFTKVIDLTQKAQRERRTEQDMKSFAEPEDALPSVSIEDLPERVQSAISAAGWESLMTVQEKAMPYLLEGRDMIVQSRTGSGKTGAFLLPLFELIDSSVDETQALLLTPTRELARQIHEEFERMKLATTETNELRAALVYGGVKYGPQIRALKRGAHIVIGTPGRILDHLQKKNFSLDALSMLVFDEADEMLSMGFYPDMQKLKQYLPRERQSCMFSATIPPKVRSLAREFLDEPQFMSLSTGQISVEAIEHRYYLVKPMEKDRALISVIEMENPDSALIFSNTKRDVEYLTKFLRNYGHNADAISGDLSQKAREEAMDRIRRGELRFLVATDVAARGIDITDLSHVFIYDVPQDPEYYVHRTGRTARAGKAGVAIAFATFDDERDLQKIGRHYGIEMEKCELPTQKHVSQRVSERLTVILEGIMRKKGNMERDRLQRYVPLVQSLAEEEPELLAMLIDDLYMEHLHSAPGADDVPEAEAAGGAQEEEDGEDERGQRAGRHRSRKGGGSRRGGGRRGSGGRRGRRRGK